MTEPLSDRRAAATAGALVAAVVIVLGFGSGIGAVLSRGSSGATSSPAGGRDLGTAVQGAGAAKPVTASSSGTGAHPVALTAARSGGLGAGGAPSTYDVMTPDAMTAASSPATPDAGGAGTSATPAAPGTPSASSCSGSSLAAAMVEPFWMHFKTAHLETSPGDQAASALNVDQYTKTHTVLIENMAAPAMHDVTDYGCP
jgi:hypothetical protein